MIPLAAMPGASKIIKNGALILGGVIVLGVGIYALKKYTKGVDYKQAEKKLGDGSKEGLAVQIASQLYTAMKGWGTNEKAMYDAAQQIARSKPINGLTFGDVASAFKKLYNEELLKWINSELDSKELALFNKYLNA